MLTLIIQALNLDNKWLALLHCSLKAATSDSAIFSLAKDAAITSKEVDNNIREIRELDNCLSKAATRIGHLKTSEQESKYKAVEAQIRIHNISTIKQGSQDHFRTLTSTKQYEEIEKILT